MKVKVKEWRAVAHWKWDTGTNTESDQVNDEENEEDVCGICRISFEGCCPACKVPGEDCPLS
jgi:anaphase-promoting complex subunit 11